MIEAKIVSMPKGGRRVNDRINFEATSDKLINKEQASAEQLKLGFHPAGYGFYDFRCYAGDAGIWVARWNCSGCCD